MREIKFRIYFEANEDEPAWMSEPITLLDLLHGEDIEFRNEEDTVSLPLNDFRFFYKQNEKYKIMQYTGLKDKNGKEIYEGDTLGYKNFENEMEIIGEIKYGKKGNSCYSNLGAYGWYIPNKNIENYNFYEIIGNIYDNPELLEV